GDGVGEARGRWNWPIASVRCLPLPRPLQACSPCSPLSCARVASACAQYLSFIQSAASFVQSRVGGAEMAIVLGSGLMDFVQKFHAEPAVQSVPYNEVRHTHTRAASEHHKHAKLQRNEGAGEKHKRSRLSVG